MKKRNVKVKSVIFDMDGVITNTMPDHFKAWKKIMLESGIEVSHSDIYSREGQKGIQSVKELFKKYGRVFNYEEANRLLKNKEDYFKTIAKERFIVGARTFLKSLRGKGIKLALVTGTSRHELLRILPEELRKLFSVIITGCDVKFGKPHPMPYLKSLKNLRINADDAVVIENAPFGIESAKRAGIKCFALETSLPRQYLTKADAVFSSIKKLEQSINFVY